VSTIEKNQLVRELFCEMLNEFFVKLPGSKNRSTWS
jgi:hypothetical protein